MPKDFEIYHNPRCSKSRETLKMLRDKGIEPEIIEYLKDTPTAEELKVVLSKLHLNAEDIIRKNEQVFKDRFKDMNFNADEWVDILVENPRLIERPIVLKGNTGVIGRPPENIEKLF